MSDQLTVFIMYLFFKRNSIFKHNYARTFDVSCGMFSNVISLILRDGDTDSEIISLIWRSVSDGQINMQFKGCITDRLLLLLLSCCFTSTVNIYGHIGTVSQPNHTFPGQA